MASLLGEQGIQTRKERKLIKDSLLSRLLLWVTGFQSQGGTLRDSVEYFSELSQLRGKEVGYLSSNSHLSLAQGWFGALMSMGIQSVPFPLGRK